MSSHTASEGRPASSQPPKGVWIRRLSLTLLLASVAVMFLLARHPWLRTGLVLLAAAAVLAGGVRLWASVPPDAVQITITRVVRDPDTLRTLTRTVTYDQTVPSGAVAQRLQRDLAAMPLNGPFDSFGCPTDHPVYNAYTLTWFCFGLPVEQASASRTACGLWTDDIVFSHRPAGAETMYADIYAAIASPTTAHGQTERTARPASDARSV